MKDQEKEIKYQLYRKSEEIRQIKKEMAILRAELIRIRDEKTMTRKRKR